MDLPDLWGSRRMWHLTSDVEVCHSLVISRLPSATQRRCFSQVAVRLLLDATAMSRLPSSIRQMDIIGIGIVTIPLLVARH